MTSIIILLGIVSLYAMAHKILSTEFNVPDEFACGSDEVCYCDKAPDCKKNGK